MPKAAAAKKRKGRASPKMAAEGVTARLAAVAGAAGWLRLMNWMSAKIEKERREEESDAPAGAEAVVAEEDWVGLWRFLLQRISRG